MKDYDYDEIPQGYYHKVMTEGSPGHQFWHREKFAVVASFISQGPLTLLDIGCGPGSFFYILRQQRGQLKLIGTDFSLIQLEFARKLIPEAHWLVADATKMPFLPESFDFITMIEVIEHLPPEMEKTILEQIKCSLKPGGKLVMTTPNYRSLWPVIEWIWNRISPVKYEDQHINRKNLTTMARSLRKVGFQVKTARSFFVLSPLLAVFSPKWASWLLQLEQKWLPRLGAIMVMEAQVPLKNSKE